VSAPRSVSPSAIERTTDDGSMKLVSGHALSKTTRHPPYKYWRDREIENAKKKLEFVPKNYY
jgi:hypothetical protein